MFHHQPFNFFTVNYLCHKVVLAHIIQHPYTVDNLVCCIEDSLHQQNIVQFCDQGNAKSFLQHNRQSSWPLFKMDRMCKDNSYSWCMVVWNNVWFAGHYVVTKMKPQFRRQGFFISHLPIPFLLLWSDYDKDRVLWHQASDSCNFCK